MLSMATVLILFPPISVIIVFWHLLVDFIRVPQRRARVVRDDGNENEQETHRSHMRRIRLHMHQLNDQPHGVYGTYDYELQIIATRRASNRRIKYYARIERFKYRLFTMQVEAILIVLTQMVTVIGLGGIICYLVNGDCRTSGISLLMYTIVSFFLCSVADYLRRKYYAQ